MGRAYPAHIPRISSLGRLTAWPLFLHTPLGRVTAWPYICRMLAVYQRYTSCILAVYQPYTYTSRILAVYQRYIFLPRILDVYVLYAGFPGFPRICRSVGWPLLARRIDFPAFAAWSVGLCWLGGAIENRVSQICLLLFPNTFWITKT